MNATLRNLLVASTIAVGMILTPYAEAQVSRPAPTRSSATSRNDRNNNNKTNNRPSRPVNTGNNSRPGNNGNSRPGNGSNNSRPGNNGNHNGNSKPGNNGNYNPGKPGNNGNHNGNYKPGKPGNNGNHNGNHKPGKPGNNGIHNGHNGGVSHWPGYRPPSGPAPVVRPGTHRPNWSTPVPPPHRNYRPIGRPIPRPVPPHGYHPCHTAPVIHTILGITFGTLYNASLDYLYSKGYEIDGYADNTVYLRNVPEMGYTWPDATIYYDSYGRLASSQFIYSTSFSALGRYDRLYHTLSMTYGSPVSASWNGAHRETIWYGGDARGYVSLEYDYSGGRYYTILSYGI